MSPASSVSRILAAAEMAAYDLSRRRLALALITALPLAFYFFTKTSQGGSNLTAGGIGMSWAISAAGLFVALDSRAVDERLVLDGYRPRELLIGRLVTLLVLGFALAAVVGGRMLGVSQPPGQLDLMLAMALVAVVAVPLGLAVGALVPHELEGILILIGLIGIQIGLPSANSAVALLPLGNAQRLLDHAARDAFSLGPAIGGSVGWALLLMLVAAVAFHRRLAIRRAGTRSRNRLAVIPITLTTMACAVALAFPLTSAAGTDDGNLGSQAFGVVVKEWGVCLEFAGVPLGDASGTGAEWHGEPGFVITLPAGARFFVDLTASRKIAIPYDGATRNLITKGHAIDSRCERQ